VIINTVIRASSTLLVRDVDWESETSINLNEPSNVSTSSFSLLHARHLTNLHEFSSAYDILVLHAQGVNMQDRKRIFAWLARQGLPNMSNRGAHVHPSSRRVMYRVKLLFVLTAWSSWCMLSATLTRSWFLVVGLFGPVLFEDV
jgi:hypothetical protein